MRKIIAVDDNLLILKSLRRLFVHSKYELVIMESPLEALEYMAAHPIDLIISDMRMPVMDGYTLLTQVKEKYPQVFRIILSGYTDEKIVFEALKHNIAKLYISKPWNDEELIKLIDQIFETEAQLNADTIKVIVNNLEDLPTVQENYRAILDLLDRDRDISEIAKLIERDPSIAMKILHVANSAFFGLKTGSVKHAASFLGARNLKNLIFTTGLVDTLGGFVTGQRYLEDIWKHAFLTNNIMQFIYEKFLGKKVGNDIYSAGLLHNIGVAMLLKVYHERYIEVLKIMDQEGHYIIHEENNAFSLNHQEVGAYLIRWWDLPYPIVEAALYHHNPLDPRIIHTELVYVVHLAQYYAWKLVNPKIKNVFFLECFDRLNIRPDLFEKTFEETQWL